MTEATRHHEEVLLTKADIPTRIQARPAFGVDFDLIGYEQMVREVTGAVEASRQLTIGYLNLHGAYLYHANEAFRTFILGASRIYADGVPLFTWRRLLWQDCRPEHRFTLTHLLVDLMVTCRDRGWTVYYVGSEQKVLEAGIAELQSQVPGLNLVGRSGFFDKNPASAECAAVVDAINNSDASILLVGMGMPVQETWIQNVKHQLSTPVIWAVGGAIEYYSGSVPMAPVWMNRYGIEWAFRLAQRPRRFAYRYLVEPLYLLPNVVADVKSRLAGKHD